MKNRTKKIIAVGLGVCFWALWFVLLLFATKPYTEKVVIWLPDNYRLQNIVSSVEVVSIMPSIDSSHQSDEVFYSEIGMKSFKRLFGGNSEREASVKIEDTGRSNTDYYQIIYQTKFDCDKSFIVVAREYYRYNKRTLLEMRIRGKELFLKNKRNIESIYLFSTILFIVIASPVFLYLINLSMSSKQSNN